MKKDSRFWIMIGALVLVAGLFLAFLWSVMMAPSQPATVQPVANVTETVTNGTADAVPADGKPADPTSGSDSGSFGGFDSPQVTPTPPDTDRIIREANEAAERMRAQAAEAEARARAQANQALERARQQTQRARQRARPQPAGDKPEDDGKPPEDW